jgi:hypothetical protein
MVSLTVTFIDPNAELPESSVAVKVTVVSPGGNAAGALLVITTFASQMSVAVAINDTTVPVRVACSTVTSAGAVRIGGVVSLTVTFVVALALLPESSVAVKVTDVTPSGNIAGALLVITTSASQISVAVGLNGTTVPARVACSTVT